MESPAMSTSPMSLMGQGSCKPAYCTANPVPNIPENNQVQLIDYRGAKIAAFTVEGRELICLPQAFELFLKHLVGGLHTVYTKLKRLEISPVVCNVEQVRILRGLGAIQPGVNRCKLIAPGEFDVLYEDCTNSSARPGRPPKRSMSSPDELSSEGVKRGQFEHSGHPRLSDLSSLHFRFPMHTEEKKLVHPGQPFPPGCYPHCPPPHAAAALGMLPFLPFGGSPAAAFYHQSRLLQHHHQNSAAAAAAAVAAAGHVTSQHHRLPPAIMPSPHHSQPGPLPPPPPPPAMVHMTTTASSIATSPIATSAAPFKMSPSGVINGGSCGLGGRLETDDFGSLVSSGSNGKAGHGGIMGLANFLPRVSLGEAERQSHALEIMAPMLDKQMSLSGMTCVSSGECPRNQLDNPLPSESSDAEPTSPEPHHESESDGCPSSLEDGIDNDDDAGSSSKNDLIGSGQFLRNGSGAGGPLGDATSPANLDSLVVNIENILRTVAENARVIERYHATTSYDFRNAMNAERKKVQLLKMQLTEERQRRGAFQKKWKRELRLRQKLEELMSSGQSQGVGDASHSTSKDDSLSLETPEDLSMNNTKCDKLLAE